MFEDVFFVPRVGYVTVCSWKVGLDSRSEYPLSSKNYPIQSKSGSLKTKSNIVSNNVMIIQGWFFAIKPNFGNFYKFTNPIEVSIFSAKEKHITFYILVRH